MANLTNKEKLILILNGKVKSATTLYNIDNILRAIGCYFQPLETLNSLIEKEIIYIENDFDDTPNIYVISEKGKLLMEEAFQVFSESPPEMIKNRKLFDVITGNVGNG